ncbi:hypothetical protein J3R03_006544 [Actinoplanes couchii]|nr:hypothetical protein [Actinoplanes couchii]
MRTVNFTHLRQNLAAARPGRRGAARAVRVARINTSASSTVWLTMPRN